MSQDDNYPFGPVDHIDPIEEYAVIQIPMEDNLIHTDENPECADPTCPCHSEQEGTL